MSYTWKCENVVHQTLQAGCFRGAQESWIALKASSLARLLDT